MSPDRMPGPAYWASGGEVRSRGGPLTPERAVEIAEFLERQAEGSRETGDSVAAGVCGRMALDLRRAIAAANDWRRAAGVFGAFQFVCDAKTSEYG
jgi:hypothetical protein